MKVDKRTHVMITRGEKRGGRKGSSTERIGPELALQGVFRPPGPRLLRPVALPRRPERGVHDGREGQVAHGGLDGLVGGVYVELRLPVAITGGIGSRSI